MRLHVAPKRLFAVAILILAVLASVKPAYANERHSGRLEIRHTDDWARGESSTRYMLHGRAGSKEVRPNDPPRIASDSPVVVEGTERDGVISGDVKPAAGARTAAAPLGTWDTAVLLFNFTNDRREPWTPAAVSTRFFTDAASTSVFFQEQSWGQVDLAGDVHGWYQLAQSSSGCDVDAWADEADAIAAAAGVNLDAYDSVAYVFPRVSDCGWAGLAELPGDQLWLNGDVSVRIASHELGHNMGVHHASAVSCGNQAIGDSCSRSEYGDPFSSMGSGSRRMAGWHLQQLSYMSASNVRSVSTSGTYGIRTTLTRTSEAQLLKIPKGTGGSRPEYYYVDLRASGGVFDNFSLTDPVVQGVTIRVGNDRHVLRQSKLIDTTPNSYSRSTLDFRDAPLAAGRTFSDGNVAITPRSIAGGVATVDVTWGGPAPDTQAPSAPANLVGTDDGTGIALGWSPSTDDVGVAGYRVKRDGHTIATVTGTTYRDTVVSPGRSYTYCVEAFDAAGNAAVSPYCTAPDRYVAPVVAPPPVAPPPPPAPPPSAPRDRERPRVTIHSPTRNKKVRLRRKMTVRASAKDNGRIVRMDLIARRRLVATKRGDALRVAWKIKGLKPGRHTLTVVAYDAGGNQAQRSVAVRVKR